MQNKTYFGVKLAFKTTEYRAGNVHIFFGICFWKNVESEDPVEHCKALILIKHSMKRERGSPEKNEELLPESSGHNLALTVLHMPSLLDSGSDLCSGRLRSMLPWCRKAPVNRLKVIFWKCFEPEALSQCIVWFAFIFNEPNLDPGYGLTSVWARRTARLRSVLTGYRKPSRTADESKST